MKTKRFSQLLNLFYPRICTCCETHLLDQEQLICLTCRFDLPFVDNADYITNPTTKVFEGRVPIEYGASFLFYHAKGKTKQLIQQLKYKGQQEIGVFIGNWFGRQLINSQVFQNADYIVPVPLHKTKLKKRGYNQLTTFGKTLSEILGVHYKDQILRRISFTKTQTRKKRLDRFQNTASRFFVENSKFFINKHVIIIDDVVTTGATLEACCKELLKSEGVKISIITIGITE